MGGMSIQFLIFSEGCLNITPNVPSIADGGTTEKLTSKYKQNDNKKQIFGK